MGMKIEAGAAWEYLNIYPPKEDHGKSHPLQSVKPADGVELTMADSPALHYLLNTEGQGGPIFVHSDCFVTQLEVLKALSLEVSTKGEVIAERPFHEKLHYVLIGKNATLQLGEQGDPSYLKLTNKMEVQEG